MDQQPSYEALVNRVAILEQELYATKEKLTAVEKSEQLYRLVVDKAQDPIYVSDVATGSLFHVNPAARKMLGRFIGKVEGHNISNAVVPEEKAISDARFDRLINGATLEPQEYRIISEDGKKVPVEANPFIIDLDDRKYLVNIHRNISHRKKAEAQMRESERRYRLIMDHAIDPILFCDVETNIIIDANRALQEMLGRTLAELKQMAIYDIVSRAQRDTVKKRLKLLQKEKTLEPQEYVFKKNGEKIFVEAKSAIIELKGRKTIISIHRDITDRKRYEKQLRESETEHRHLIETLNDGFSISDKENRLTYVNEKFCSMLGYSSDEILGKTVDVVIRDKKNQEIIKEQIAKRREGITKPYEIELTAKDGNQVPVLACPQAVFDQKGHFQGSFGTLVDLSEFKKTEQDLRRSEKTREAILNATTESVLLVDVDGTILAINKVGAARLGSSVRDITGMTLEQYLPADVAKRRRRLIKQGYRSRKPFQFQDERKGRIISSSFYPIYNENKKVEAFAVFARDVTKEKQTLASLEASTSHFKSLLENSDEYILLSDHEGKPIVWNKAYAQIMKDYLGIDMEPGLQPHKLLPDKEAITWWDNVHKRALSGEKFHVEYALESPKDGLKHLNISYNPVISGGRVAGFSEITHDITELKESLIRAEENEETARALLNAPRCYTALLDPNGVIVDANQAMAQRFGKNREDFIGVHGWNLLPPGIAAKREHKFNHVIKTKKVIHFEDEREGTWFENVFFPVLNADNEVVKVGCFAFDITDRKSIENRLRDYADEKEVLVREVHHRVKNNMQIIIGLLHLQALQVGDKKINDMFQNTQNRISTMALIHEKLYQSDNMLTIKLESYLKDLANSLFDSFNVNPKKVSFRTEIAGIHLSIERAIPIGLILNELVSNALKHAFPDTRTGEIRVEFCPAGEDEVELTVSDNGTGLSEGVDINNGRTLGLNLVKTLTERQLHGTLQIKNDHGTQFKIRFSNT